MIRIYGLPTCPDCDTVHEQIAGREEEFTFINIGEHVRNLKAFMQLRDSDPVFDSCKETGQIGIPAFVFEDGHISLDPKDAGLLPSDGTAACSIEDHRNGRNGC